jgi:hypothetical protein
VVPVDLLSHQADAAEARQLAEMLARLDPTVDDLANWHDWAVAPRPELMAAVRPNSTISTWLDALPFLSPS